MEQVQTPPMDPGNSILAPGPAQLAASQVQTTNGAMLAVTVRTPSTTVTVFLTREDAAAWGAHLSEGAGALTGLILPSQACTALTA